MQCKHKNLSSNSLAPTWKEEEEEEGKEEKEEGKEEKEGKEKRQGQTGLHSKFQDSQGYLMKLCLKQQQQPQQDFHVEGLTPQEAVLRARARVVCTHRLCVGTQECEGLALMLAVLLD